MLCFLMGTLPNKTLLTLDFMYLAHTLWAKLLVVGAALSALSGFILLPLWWCMQKGSGTVLPSHFLRLPCDFCNMAYAGKHESESIPQRNKVIFINVSSSVLKSLR